MPRKGQRLQQSKCLNSQQQQQPPPQHQQNVELFVDEKQQEVLQQPSWPLQLVYRGKRKSPHFVEENHPAEHCSYLPTISHAATAPDLRSLSQLGLHSGSRPKKQTQMDQFCVNLTRSRQKNVLSTSTLEFLNNQPSISGSRSFDSFGFQRHEFTHLRAIEEPCSSGSSGNSSRCDQLVGLLSPVLSDTSMVYSPSFSLAPPKWPLSLNRQHPESPLPKFRWADSNEVWGIMCNKEKTYRRDINLLHRHPTLQPRMRTILLDWLAEVCDVYKLHRETWHLAVDYVDRYLSGCSFIVKQQLQLVGITALFIASKLEEIYPPKLREFAYVTDGACSEENILDMEINMLQVLQYFLSPVTANSWLICYLQAAFSRHQHRRLSSPLASISTSLSTNGNDSSRFEIPSQSQVHTFLQLSRLVDLCLHDVGSIAWSYSMLAACAILHLCDLETANISGYSTVEMQQCALWMRPFAQTVFERGELHLRLQSNVAMDDQHNIQNHAVDLQLVDRAQFWIQELNSRSPVFQLQRSVSDIYPTPPSSGERPAQPPLYASNTVGCQKTPTSVQLSTNVFGHPLQQHNAL